MKNHLLLILLALSLLQFSCNKKGATPLESCDVVIKNGRMRNPYTATTGGHLRVKPTHQYCKFYIHNIAEYQALENKGVYLQSLPMDEYTDRIDFPVTTTAKGFVFYGVVPDGVDVSSFNFELADNAFIPEKVNANERVSGVGLGKKISGTVKFMNPVSNQYTELAGVKVIVKDVYKTASAYTDKDGNFTITDDEIYSDTVQVLLEFSNDYYEIRTLNIGRLGDIVFPNKYSLGYKKACGLTNMQIEIGPDADNAALQHAAALLLSLNQYKKFAQDNQLKFPTKKMVIWNAVDAVISTSYSAPMLNNINLSSSTSIDALLTQLFNIPAALTPTLRSIIGDKLPDIYAPYYNRNSNRVPRTFIETMFHEFTHASHYAQAGDAFWQDYIAYIFANGGYGDVTKPGSGMIQLSEAWAEDVSNFCAYQIYGDTVYIRYNEKPYTDFIPYGIYHDINDNAVDTIRHRTLDEVSGFTFTQMYQLLQSNVRTQQQFRDELKLKLPAQAGQIDSLYVGYGF
jgi:hypothetical protein